ncbi:DNA translocase FtsK [Hymenobacter nivis]|uniref:FtsK gamma domain-containing protein n=1 Tax=Hymenobacter nivis TaxID=1850093 RepID=A0A502GUA0_9BACT|nr:DNA translocase FtsK [Hymenobacter nivis]TPG65799.1 hypothetical protein EAH73_10400 [Hymenobacter nivis]
MQQPTSSAPTTHALANTLLTEWEQQPSSAFAPADPAARLRTLAQLVPLCACLLVVEDVNVEADDIRTTLAGATSFGVATATANGPGRAAQLVAAIRFHHHGLAPTSPARRILLSITSRLDAPLDMDELTFVIETVRDMVGEDTEMIFGHGEYDEPAGPELQLCVLVGYGAPALAAAAPRPSIPTPPPGPDGRDAAFAEAARLLVQRQKASSGLLQRELKLGYNRAHRVVHQLQQAGIISTSAAGQSATVLIADEAHLAEHLARLPNTTHINPYAN